MVIGFLSDVPKAVYNLQHHMAEYNGRWYRASSYHYGRVSAFRNVSRVVTNSLSLQIYNLNYRPK